MASIYPLVRLVRMKQFLLTLAILPFFNAKIPLWAQSGTPTLKYSPSLTHVPLVQGSTATDVFTFTSGGSFQGNVTLTVSGLPAGVTGSWSENQVTLTSGAGSSTLTLRASATAVANWFTFTVSASGDGLTVSTVYTVEVAAPPGAQIQIWISTLTMQSMGTANFEVEAVPLGGVTVAAGAAGASAEVLSGLPSGVSASWSIPTVTASGAVMWTLTLTGSPTAIAGSSTLKLSLSIENAGSSSFYSSSTAIPLTIVLTPPRLSFSPTLTHLPVKEGSTATDVFTFTSGGSFTGNIALTVSGLPSGVISSWSYNPVELSSGIGSSVLTLTADPTAVVNWFNFTVTGSGDGLNVSNVYTVEVEPSTGVLIQLSQSSLSIEPNGTATLSVIATPIHGVIIPGGATGASAAVGSALPSGVTASWSQPGVTAAGAVNWTLTLAANGAAKIGNDPVALSVQIQDATSGTVYSTSPTLNLLVGLLANVSIGDTPGTKIPATFMGLAHEWGQAQAMMGDSTTGVNQIYRQLVTNLTAYGSGPINLRIGGNSTDTTGEPTSTTVMPFAEVAEALGSKFELGVNLGSDNVNLATAQAEAYMSQMPAGSVEAVEIGNEPDDYPEKGLRPQTYTVQDYYSDFYTWKQNIMPVLPTGTKLMGASWAVTSMLPNIDYFESDYARDLTVFSQHFYVTNPATNPSMDFLLTPGAATSGPSQVATAVALTHADGLPFRIGELNSISVGGVHGISDAFGAALWSVDTMFGFANVGVDGVNWQSLGGYYSPFLFSSSFSGGIATYTLNAINPLYYGMLLFQAATGNEAQILTVDLNTQANLKAWATVDASGTQRLVLINKDESLAGTVAVDLAGYSQASVVRLTAPSYTSTSGVEFGGQTFDGSLDGRLQGTPTVETIDSIGGVFYLPMPTTSAALVIFTQ